MTKLLIECENPANRKLCLALTQTIRKQLVNSQPRTVQMFFDGVEVLRIEDGKKCHEILFPPDHQPDLMEMRWDGEVVYAVSPTSDKVLINRLP